MVKQPERRWHNVGGFAGAFINTLFDLGWKAVNPGKLVSHIGQEWRGLPAITASATPVRMALRDVINDLGNAIHVVNWTGAAAGYHGKGLEGGADWMVTRRAIAAYKKKGEEAAAGMVKCIACAGHWSPARRAETLGLALRVHPPSVIGKPGL